MPHLRPLGDLVDPRLGVAARRGARRRLVRFLRRSAGLPALNRSRPSAWHQRTGRNVVEVPDSWRTVDRPRRPAEWAVVIHDIGRIDVRETLGDLLRGDHPPFDLFIVSGDAPRAGDLTASARIDNCRVLPALGEGDDWALCALVNSGLLDPYRVVLRRTTHAVAQTWHPDPHTILRAFAADPGLGLVSPSAQLVTPRRARRGVRRLLRRLELSAPQQAWMAPTGQDYWSRGFLLQGLRALNLTSSDFSSGNARRAVAGADTFRQTLGALAAEAGCSVVAEERLAATPTVRHAEGQDRARVLALYLPQFHPIEENDQWWGPGFTEWTNVTAARPVYPGHFQPKLPLDLGFYDLRLDEPRRLQAELAEAHGVAGFMYYHYWFAGRQLLEQPINALLRSELDFPFCIMWANENWTRAWDGGDAEILMAQNYDGVPAATFIDDALPLLRDRRYVRIGGRALIAVYRPGQIPHFPAVVADWRRRAAEHGLELFIVSVDVPRAFDGLEGPSGSYGLDGHMGFPPHRRLHAPSRAPWLRPKREFTGMTYDYGAMVRADEEALSYGVERSAFPGVMTGFDNTARRQWSSIIWVGSNPYTFRRWLSAAVSAVSERPSDERVVIVNAWNEWAEGAILEPTTRFGHTFLLAVRDVVRDSRGTGPVQDEPGEGHAGM